MSTINLKIDSNPLFIKLAIELNIEFPISWHLLSKQVQLPLTILKDLEYSLINFN